MYNVTIISAGPAGATLVRLLGNDYKVLLLEKQPPARDKSRIAEKCCGGLLVPDAQTMLGRMRLGLPRDILVDPQLFVVQTN